MSKSIFVTAVAIGVFVLDQLTKWYVRQAIPLYHSVSITSFFNVTHVLNSGGAFSLFADAGAAVRIPFFVVATALAVGALIYFVRQVAAQQHLLLFALAAILGGAIGNLTDRITAGQVTDFLDAHWRSHHWPAFNVADSFITIGVTLLVIHSLFAAEDDPDREESP